MTADRAIDILMGRVGTPVKLGGAARGDQQGRDVLSMVSSAMIDVPSVLGDSRNPDDTWDYMLDHDKKIGYIRITNFIQNTAEELKHALVALKDEGVKGLILDLRDNPGGLLSSAVEISNLFVDRGKIVSTKGRNTPTKSYEAQGDARYTDFPMVVMVNGGSASAAEIVSACLQDHQRAQVIGQRSFGKGSVQNIIELEGGNSVLKLTVATYQRPSGKNIHRFKNAKESDEWGVSPDSGLETKLTPQQYFEYRQGRHFRDLRSLRKNRKSAGDAPKNEQAAEKTKSDAAKAQNGNSNNNEPPAFVDLQRNKAVELIEDDVTRATAKK